MSNQSYMGVWLPDFRGERMLRDFGAFLQTVPFSPRMPGFTHLVIRAVDSAESPVLEHDLRSAPLDSEGVLGIARDHMQSDCSCELRAHWDLWVLAPETGAWRNEPQPLEIYCHAPDYDGEFWREAGHIQVRFGFEHLFTGHAGLLDSRRAPAPAESPEEARFAERMAWPENLSQYRDRTRENIRKVIEWPRRAEHALPAATVRLWSEGEENFEARIEEILAAT